MIGVAYHERMFLESSHMIVSEVSIVLEGVVDEIPTTSEHTTSARVKGEYGYVLMRFERGSNIAYGDQVRIEGTCEIPESFKTSTGMMFDYRSYLMARGIHHVCTVDSYIITSRHQGGMIQDMLYRLRLWFSDHLDGAFVSPHAGLVKGVLLGDKSGLSDELKADMTIAGVIHIAVLSGSNIAIVAMLIFALTRVLPYRLRIITTITMVIWFILLSGAEPPAVRAGLLVIIIFVGKWIHRAPHTGRALFCIAVCMIINNPFALIFDMSFQLSFLATIGIVYVAPVVERYTWWITEKYGLREVVAGTIGAQITVTPLLLYATGALSIVSLPANILIGWSVPLLMLCGFVAGVLHVISYIVAAPVIWIGEWFSKYIIFVTEQAAHIPYAQLVVPVHYPVVLCSMYVMLFLIVKRLQNVQEKESN